MRGGGARVFGSKAIEAMARWGTTTSKCVEALAVVPSSTSTLVRRRPASPACRALLHAWQSSTRSTSTDSRAWNLFPPPRQRTWTSTSSMTTSAALPSSSSASTSTTWTNNDDERRSTSLCSESLSTSNSDFLIPPMRLPPGEVHVWWLLEGGGGRRKKRDGDDGAVISDDDNDDDGLFLRDGATGEILGPSPLLERAARRLMPLGAGVEEDGYLSSENGKSNNNKTPAERARSLAARVLVRWALGRYAGVHPSSLPLARGGNGKPLLVSSSATIKEEEEGEEETTTSTSTSSAPPCCSLLEFNLTHTEGLIGVAVSSPGFAVGLDCELWSRSLSRATKGGCLQFARKKFTQLEAEALESIPEGPRRDAEFNALWTLKEAALKATGKGIGGVTGSRLKSVEFEFVGGGNGSGEKRTRDDGAPLVSSPRAALEAAVPGIPVPRSRSDSAPPKAENPLKLLGPRGILFRDREGEDGEGRENKGWNFVLLSPTTRHVAALCVSAPDSGSSRPPLRVRVWRADVSSPDEGSGGVRAGFGREMPRGAAALACSLPSRKEKK